MIRLRNSSTACVIISVLLAMLFSITSCENKNGNETNNKQQETPYYSFGPSTKGLSYKYFRHNIFGFSIQMPSNWTFGVNGQHPLAVLFIYPENIETGVFSENYETIEISQLPIKKTSLVEAYTLTMIGMKQKHPNIIDESTITHEVIQGNNTLSWIYKWKSKTGFTISEYITLIKYKDAIRSLAVRTTREYINPQKQFYDSIISTYVPYDPIY